ncbi:hypothetical protein H0H81_001270, partial [Sphagnurus paluster]
YKPPQTDRDAIDYAVTFVLALNNIPVIFVEVKPKVAFNTISGRSGADDQMRQRFQQLYDAMPSKMVGLSALGPLVCRYSLSKEDNVINPPYIERSPQIIRDVAPQGNWDIDVTTVQGGQRILEIFEHVKDVMLGEAHEV